MRFTKILAAWTVLAALAAAAYLTGAYETLHQQLTASLEAGKEKQKTSVAEPLPPAVSAIVVTRRDFQETVLVTGSLVAREEILVAPEVEGLRVLEFKAEVGDAVKKGDVLAILVSDTLDAQIAENDAARARAKAAIAQANSQITEAEARLAEANSALERATPLRKSGWIADATFEQRDAAAKTAKAQVAAARDAIHVAEAELAQVQARRRELDWRRGNTEVKSPADGIVSRRTARIGAMAVAAGLPLYHLIQNGEIELDAEIAEERLAKIAVGQKAHIDVVGAGTVEGTVRLINPEVDKSTRLGRARILLESNPALKIGSFGRGNVDTARSNNIAVPLSAILYGNETASVQVISDGKVQSRPIKTGLLVAGYAEVISGLNEGDIVVAKAGTFLRDGDAVRAILPDAKVSEAGR
jgi:RND family efflux transporter MFP subunit